MGAVTGTATIVFTDMVGSTALRSRLGEQAADDLRREHDAMLGAVVDAHRGRVVKGAGDGIVASFDAASDAVAATVVMQQTVHALARRTRLGLSLRVGISAGDVSWEDGDCFGLPVVEAARLESVADPGQILCAEIVHHLARGRAGVTFRSLGSLALKGLDEAVPVCVVEWAPAQHRVAEGPPPCVGRTAELAVLTESWERTRGGAGGAVLVAGEPGIGKTRLLQAFALSACAAGGTVWWGMSYEGEGRPYGPISEMLDAYALSVEPSVLADQLGVGAGLVARVAPGVTRVLGGVSEPMDGGPGSGEERTVDALVQFAASVSVSGPLLVIVDDAHWADVASTGLLRTLVRRAARLAVLVAVAYREVDLDRRHPLADLLPGWRREPSVRRIALRGLEADAVGELLEDLVAQDVSGSLVEVLTSETGGNPFFVREVALHLAEEGRFSPDVRPFTDAVGATGIPEGVRDVIGRRLARLSDATNRLLAVAAAFDAGFDLGVVAAVAGLTEDEALDAIDAALTARMIRPDDGIDRYVFTHALFRHTLWAELNPSRQVRLHRSIAEQLEKAAGHDPAPEQAIVLARHFHHSAALPGSERGVPYALVAANHAASRFAATEEHHALTIALELMGDSDERSANVLERAARAAIVSRAWEAAHAHARRAIDLTARTEGPAAACGVAVRLGRIANEIEMNSGWRFGHLVASYRDVIDDTSEHGVQLLAWDVDESEYLDPHNPGIAVDSPARRHMNDLAGQLPPELRPISYLYPSPSSAEAAYRAGAATPWNLVGPGRYREAATAMRQAAHEAIRTSQPSAAVSSLGILGRLHLALGELDHAATTEAEGATLLGRVEPWSNAAFQFDALRIVRSILVDIDLGDALTRAEAALVGTDRADLRWLSGTLRIYRASMNAMLGHHDIAIAELTDNLAVIERAPIGAQNYPFAVHVAAQCLWAADRSDHAVLLERHLRAKVLEPDFNYIETDARWTAALLCALTNRPSEARSWFQQSHDRLTTQEAILLQPHVCCDEALMEIRLGDAGDRANGLRRLDQATAWTQQIGLPALRPRISDLRVGLAP